MATTRKRPTTRKTSKGKAGAGRCWKGFEPVPGKKPFSKGSCKKK